MINLIIVGIGDLAVKLIPAAKELQNNDQVSNLIFVDIKPVEKILDSFRTNKYYSWLKNQEIFQDDPSALDKIKNRVTSNNAKTVVYLATPPSSFQSCVIRYNNIAHLFVLEKPWAENPNDLEYILKSVRGKKIIGVDHYLWKESVRQFLTNRSIQSLSKSSSFDFVITEDLPKPDREYYWNYGEVADMMPHVLPLLDKLFNIDATILDSGNMNFACGVWNPNDPYYSDDNNKRIITKETFIEIESSLENKVVHVVLGKGTKFKFKGEGAVRTTRFLADDSKLLINFEEKENSTYRNILFYLANNIENILKGDSQGFLDEELLKKYVSKIDQLQKSIDNMYDVDEKRIKRSVALEKNPDLIYSRNKTLRLRYHRANKCMIIGNSHSD